MLVWKGYPEKAHAFVVRVDHASPPNTMPADTVFPGGSPLSPKRQPPMAPGPVAGPVSAPCRSRIAIASSTRAPASTVTSTPPVRNPVSK